MNSLATHAAILIISLLAGAFYFVPRQMAAGEIWGRYLTFKSLELERKSRFFRFLPSVVLVTLILARWGFVSSELATYAVGELLVAVTAILLTKNSDEATGASLEDLV